MNLILWFLLGFLATVHSSPVDAVTQIPPKGEDEVLREAITDGFLVDQTHLPSSTTESPKRNTTVQVTRQPSENEENNAQGTTREPAMFEASGAEGSGDESFNIDLMTNHNGTSTVPNEPAGDLSPSTVRPDPVSHSTLSPDIFSGDGERGSTPDFYFTTTAEVSPTQSSTRVLVPEEYSTIPSTLSENMVTRANGVVEEIESGSGTQDDIAVVEEPVIGVDRNRMVALNPQNAKVPQKVEDTDVDTAHKGHSTPGWIIILGFIVGVAALVVICIAIATRDKWNAPRHATEASAKVNSTNQPREQEMETFLQRQPPRENGQTGEYTVIPLEDLPEKDSLQ